MLKKILLIGLLIFVVGCKNIEDKEISTNLFIGCGIDVYNPNWVGAEYRYQLGEWCENCGYCSDYDFGCWRDDEIALDWAENSLDKRSPFYFCWNSKDYPILKIADCGDNLVITLNDTLEEHWNSDRNLGWREEYNFKYFFNQPAYCSYSTDWHNQSDCEIYATAVITNENCSIYYIDTKILS